MEKNSLLISLGNIMQNISWTLTTNIYNNESSKEQCGKGKQSTLFNPTFLKHIQIQNF